MKKTLRQRLEKIEVTGDTLTAEQLGLLEEVMDLTDVNEEHCDFKLIELFGDIRVEQEDFKELECLKGIYKELEETADEQMVNVFAAFKTLASVIEFYYAYHELPGIFFSKKVQETLSYLDKALYGEISAEMVNPLMSKFAFDEWEKSEDSKIVILFSVLGVIDYSCKYWTAAKYGWVDNILRLSRKLFLKKYTANLDNAYVKLTLALQAAKGSSLTSRQE